MTEEAGCDYQARFFNNETKTFQLFLCGEKRSHGRTTCVFHSPDISLNEKDFTDLLNNKIKKYVDQNEPILLIGYNFHFRLYFKPPSSDMYLPNIEPSLHAPHINLPIYLNFSIFHKGIEITNYHLSTVCFDDVTFDGTLIIAASLLEKATFQRVVFKGVANFVMTRLLSADFSESTFNKYAKFTGAMFYTSNFLAAKFYGEANFADVSFYGPVNFNSASFFREATFIEGQIEKRASFLFVKFYEGADFNGRLFNSLTLFHNSLFKKQEEIFFNSDLSNVSFRDTDITRIRFGDSIKWRRDYKVIDEQVLEWSVGSIFSFINSYVYEKQNLQRFLEFIGMLEPDRRYDFVLNNNKIDIIEIVGGNGNRVVIGEIDLSQRSSAKVTLHNWNLTYSFETTSSGDNGLYFFSEKINIESVLSIYRNLRENYEFRLRYAEAGKFFIREMELIRIYENENSTSNNRAIRKQWLVRNFSLTGLYHILSGYGESVLRPAIFGIGILAGSMILFASLADPFEKVSLYSLTQLSSENISNHTHLDMAVERGWQDFIPLFPLNEDIDFGLVDLAIKIIGGLMTFTFLTVALKRRFERKHRH